VIHDLVYWSHTQNETLWKDNSVSITNLERLGLLKYALDQNLADDSNYDKFRQSKLFLDLYNADKSIELKRGLVKTTILGDMFKRACL
jgi:hypothetical protein